MAISSCMADPLRGHRPSRGPHMHIHSHQQKFFHSFLKFSLAHVFLDGENAGLHL